MRADAKQLEAITAEDQRGEAKRKKLVANPIEVVALNRKLP